MTPEQFPQANLNLQPPSGMKECDPLWVHKGTFSSPGMEAPFMLSRWILTPEEKKLIAETGEVWLMIHSDRHPPVSLMVKSPFT